VAVNFGCFGACEMQGVEGLESYDFQFLGTGDLLLTDLNLSMNARSNQTNADFSSLIWNLIYFQVKGVTTNPGPILSFKPAHDQKDGLGFKTDSFL